MRRNGRGETRYEDVWMVERKVIMLSIRKHELKIFQGTYGRPAVHSVGVPSCTVLLPSK